jgi:hypothetical protein
MRRQLHFWDARQYKPIIGPSYRVDDYLTLPRGLVRFSGMVGSNMWFIRRRGEVKGPYPAGLVSRYILLGRLQESDEVSSDGEEWLVINKDVPELIPPILKGNTSDPLFMERLQAARRWVDERDSTRRAGRVGQNPSPDESRKGEDRRNPEEAVLVQHRLARTTRERMLSTESRQRWTMTMIAGIVAVAAGMVVLFYTPPPPSVAEDCHSPAAPRVNWSNCVLDGIHLDEHDLSGASLNSTSMIGASLRHSTLIGGNLSYATLSVSNLEGVDLRQAILIGANLRHARLANALMDDANLSYADLTGADLSGASLQNAKLGNAIWTDGKRCLPRSIGVCMAGP